MFRKSIFFLFLMSLCTISYAQLPPLGIQDEGGTVDRPVFILDCVGDGIACTQSGIKGTITVPSGGAGSGDSITVNTTAVDTTANFLDGDIDFTLVDGGAGGPDDITATVNCTGCIDSTDLADAITADVTGNLTGNADTATALAANGANCAAGNYPLGVDASGAVEGCTADSDTTYTAGGTLLDLTGTTFSVNEGTLTDTKGCKYTALSGIVCDQDYLTSYTETDPIVGAVSGIIKADGAGSISAAVANTDYEPALTDSASLATTLSDETGTGAAVFGTSPTIATPVITLPDGNAVATTTDGQIRYDRTLEAFEVGDGTDERHVPTNKVIYGVVITNGDTAIDATVTDPVVCSGRLPNNSIITAWYLDCDQSGSIVLDVWKNTWDDTPEVNADSIAGTEKPTLTADVSNSDTSLTSMTTDWNTGDSVCIEIESASTVTKCTLLFYGYND